MGFTSPLSSQSTLKGRVELTGHMLTGATVLLLPVGRNTTTDAKGRFRFDQIDVGSYTLIIKSIEIEPLVYPVELVHGETLEVVLHTTPTNRALAGVTVYGSREFRGIGRLPEAGELQINAGKKMEVVPLNTLDANLAMNTSRQIFAKVPGTHVWESDASGIQVNVATRGLSPNRSWEYNVRQNGYDVSADPLGYPEAYYNPPMEAVDRIEVIRGAASLQYGPQFGGLLNYKLKSAPQDRKIAVESRQTTGSYGLFSSYNSIGGTTNRFDYFGSFHHRDGEGWRQNSRYNLNHGYLHLGYQFTPKFRAEIEYTRSYYKSQQAGGLTDMQFFADARQSVRARNWFSTPWNLTSLLLKYDFSSQTHLEVKTFGLLGERNSIGFVRTITIPDTLNLSVGGYNPRQIDRDKYTNWGTELRFLTNYTLGGRQQTLNIGLRTFQGRTNRRQLGKGDTGEDFNLILQDALFPRDLDFQTRNMALFAEHIFRVGKRVALIPGIRLEHIKNKAEGRININNAGEVQNIEPEQRSRTFLLAGFSTEYHATSASEFYANIAQSYRPVSFADLTPPATTAVIDPALTDAKGWVSDLGYRGRWKNFLNWDISAFYLHYGNRIGTIAQLAADGSVYQYRTNLGTSVHRGIELYVEASPLAILGVTKRLGALNAFASLSWIDARFTNFPITIVDNGVIIETNLKDNRVDNAPRYVHRIGATYAFRKFSVTWQLNTVSAVYSDAANTESPSANGQAGKIPGYDIMDISATWTFLDQYTLRAGINNLAGTRYATRRAGGYPGPGLLPGEGRTWYAGLGVAF